MAILQTKWIDVGVSNFYGTVVTGLLGTGTLSNSQNGSSDVNLDSVYSGADVSTLTHASSSGGYITFSLTGNRANGAFDTLKIGGVSFARTAATYSYSSGNNRTTWTWSSISSSPFGTTAGADKQITWETAGATVTAPVISGVSNNNAAAATVTATISLSSSGSGGTLQYAQTTSNSAPSSGWSASPAFSHPRGATRYYWARRDTNTVTSSVSHSVGYLTGDTGFSRTSPTITSGATSATTTIQYATAGETLAIRLDGQSTNLVTAVVASSSQSQNITFSSSLPSSGSSTYRFFVRRPTNTGGDGSTFVDTGLTFTVTRSADNTPNAFDLPDIGPVAPGTVGTSQARQITGMDANTPCSITGQGSPQLFVGSAGPWTTSSTISPNFYINVRLTAPTAYSSTHTATLTIGTVTDTIVITSQAAPSGSGGSGVTGGTGAYGIKVFDTDGSTSVISPSTRYMTRLTDPTSISLAATTGSSTLISCDMTGLTSSNSDIIFEQFATSSLVPVTRESNGFRITNNTGSAFSNIVYAVRF